MTARRWIALGLPGVLLAASGVVAWDGTVRHKDFAPGWEMEHFGYDTTSELLSFKYGPMATDHEELAIPYWIWLVLPKMFPDNLNRPGGYLALGFDWEEGKALPVGLSASKIGQPRVGINCAHCHVASKGKDPGHDEPRFSLGAPRHRLKHQRYVRFLSRCATDPRFNARSILTTIAGIYDMPFIDRLLYRFFIIPKTRRQLEGLEEELACGRVVPLKERVK